MAPAHLDVTLNHDELKLISQAQKGDRSAFNELVRRHRQSVIGIVYRMCGDFNVAEDAAQECFLQAWQHLDKYIPKGSFRNWLYKIAINKTHNILRTEKFTLDVDNYIVVDKNPGPEHKHEENVQAHLVQQAVISLPEASRSVLILREYEDMSYRDIADTLDIPIGTVMSRLNYARQILKRLLVGLLEVA